MREVERGGRRYGRWGALALCAAALCAAGAFDASAAAGASATASFWQKCPSGSGAGRCLIPRGIATDPVSGDVFVVDMSNLRVVELSPWGEFVKAWGWGVSDGSEELQTCSDSCEAGLQGAGAGELGQGAQGVALDSAGDVYVVDRGNHRVQKFDPAAGPGEDEAAFLLTFGGEVDKTEVHKREEQEAHAEPVTVTEADENLCTAASGHECGAGAEGVGQGRFEKWPVSSNIAIDTGETATTGDDVVYVGDRERVQLFDAEGHYLSQIPLAGEGYVATLAAAPDGEHLYAGFTASSTGFTPEADVSKLDLGGGATCTIEVPDPEALAVGKSGAVYVFDASSPKRIRRFDSDCHDLEMPFAEGVFSRVTGLGVSSPPTCGLPGEDVFGANAIESDSFVDALGPHPDTTICPPPPVPPEIDSQFAVSVAATSAALRGLINPHFWGDATYHLEYGTGKCSQGGCPLSAPATDANLGGPEDEALPAPVSLSGLQPATTYHFRFAAQSCFEFAGEECIDLGGPVYGPDPDGEGPREASPAEGLEGSFTTYPLPAPPKSDCPNQAMRSGASASLPDCRAYELVSPVDKDNGDVEVLPSSDSSLPARLDQASAGGDSVTYSSYRAFADPASSPYVSQYLARRSGAGWSSEAISPPREGPSFFISNSQPPLDSQFKLFGEDLCSAWLRTDTEPVLAPGGLAGYPDLYRRSGCGPDTGGFEAITGPGSLIPSVEPDDFISQPQGSSTDGSHTVFRSAGRLTAAGASGAVQVYEASGGQLALVCVLPNGHASSQSCSAGSGASNVASNRSDNLWHAVSADGSRVYWTAAATGAGPLYVRLNPMTPQGSCSMVDRACTVPISDSPSTTFWGASSEGSRAIYTAGGQLFEFELATKTSRGIASGVAGVMGMSEDARRVYFTSTEQLGEGPNGEGELPREGEPNLYLYSVGREGSAGSFTFVATLTDADTASVSSAMSVEPYSRLSRVTADGLRAAFMSRGPALNGYDNTDAASGEVDAEVYRYDATTGAIACVSCNPSGARPGGVNTGSEAVPVWRAAQIPGWEYDLHASRSLSADGSRLFFESFEPLVLRDTNGAPDVYEWEAGSSQADCERRLGADLYVPSSGGCLALISSGKSPEGASFIDASADGRDIFFTTQGGLVASDPGQLDLYDARAGGGFEEPSPPSECEGEACQGFAPSPEAKSPASSAYRGPGNLRRNRCAATARKAKRLAHRARRLRRAARRTHRRPLARKAHRLAHRSRRLSRRAHRCRRRARRAAGRKTHSPRKRGARR